MSKIFISYKRDRELDDAVARTLHDHFGQEHEVFIDQRIAPGTNWARRLEDELRSSDFVFLLLSADSVLSEMVRGEIELVRSIKASERPTIIPIRIAFTGQLPYPLNAFLDPLQWVMWSGPHDDPELLRQVGAALANEDLEFGERASVSSVARLPKAPAAAASPPVASEDVYIERPGEAQRLQAIRDDRADTLHVVGPRHMGKTRFIDRLALAAEEAGKLVVRIDFKLFDAESLADLRSLCAALCDWFAEDLELDPPADGYWTRGLVPRRCLKFMSKSLRAAGNHVVLVLDEVERVLQTEGKNDFFGMLRALHEERKQVRSAFKKLDLVLVASMNLHRATGDAHHSPFNVGQRFELVDFERSQVQQLARAMGVQLSTPACERLHALLGGHPLLTQRALAAHRDDTITFDADTAVDELLQSRSPFADHMRWCSFSLEKLSEAELRAFRASLRHGRGLDPDLFWRLEGSGFVRGTYKQPVPRCELYAAFFTAGGQ